MSKGNNKLSYFVSLVTSLFGWFLLGLITFSLFMIDLVLFWPISFLFDGASGYLPHRISQLWASLISAVLPYWEIRAAGLERIRRGKAYVVVSNHQSLLDILVVLAKLPLHFKFIAKKELFPVPCLGWHLALAGYIPLKRGDWESGRACLEQARRWLRRGVSVIFFPEGTRSPDGEIHDFKPGAFKLALEEKIDILPLAIYGTREAIPKYSWRIERHTPLQLQVLEPVSVRNLSLKDLVALQQKVRENIVREFHRLKEERTYAR
jgi:1-acyl-sn-glycerol-3-phosphate acyltransferase